MVIAVTAEGNQVFQHFGHTKLFKLFTVEEGKVVARSDLDTSMSGHEALAVILRQNGVSLLICGGIGGGAKAALQSAGIELVAGASGDIETAVADYLSGALQHNPNVQCTHHHGEGHEHGHTCGHHHE
ncbi:MAG: NifB/NifX family molybdenum-iron cluster-binding protein [Oscillospiraceae bacterium]|jgi:predicted Fe-Mo cluster-binding NifX family protein